MPRTNSQGFSDSSLCNGLDTVLEFTMYFDYEKDSRHKKFEARSRMTMAQLVEFGGLSKLQRMMDDMLYDALGIQSDEFDKSTIGWRPIPDAKPTPYGTYKIHDVYGRHVYPEGEKWNSLYRAWRK